MKLRQKLALTMAASMLLTAAPIATMAASTNNVINAGGVLHKGEVYNLPGISIQFKDARQNEEFFLTLEGAEWLNQNTASDVRKEALKTVNGALNATSTVLNQLEELGFVSQTREFSEEFKKNLMEAVYVMNSSYANINSRVKEARLLGLGYGSMLEGTTTNAAAVVNEALMLEYINTNATDDEICDQFYNQVYTLIDIHEELIQIENELAASPAPRSMGGDMALIGQAGFVINSIDGTWTKTVQLGDDNHTVTIKYTRQTGSTMKVEVTGVQDGDKVQFPMPVKVTAEEVKVTVDPNGGNSSVTGGTYTVVAAADKQFSLAVATGDDLKHFYNEGELSTITLNERFLNSFASKGQELALRIELDNDEFEFDENSNVTIEGRMGYDFKAESFNQHEVLFVVDSEDKATAYVIINPNRLPISLANSKGKIDIKGIKVRSFDKEIELGDLKADIVAVKDQKIKAEKSVDNGVYVQADEWTIVGGAELDKEYKDAVLAKVEKYGATITMKDEKAVDIVAGREQDVEFTVKENVDDVFVGERTLTLSLKDNEGATDKEYFMLTRNEANHPWLIIDEIANNKDTNIVQDVELTFVDKEGDLKAANATDANEYAKQNMVRVKEIKVKFAPYRNGLSINKNDERDSFTVKTKVYVPVSEQDKKTIDVVGELRGEEVKAATAVNVIDPFDVTFDTTTVKVGLQDQVVNTYAIKETDKEMFNKGTLEMKFVSGKKGGDGIILETKGNMDVTEGTLKKANLGSLTQGNKVDFKRQSKAAATLTFKDAKITVDRTVPEGLYDLKLSGSAVDKYDGSYTVSKFLNIGTQNTQDIQETNGLSKVEAVFTVGANKYMVEGVEAEMDATPYIQDGGNIMVPVRYVSEAFGVKPQNILVNGNVITIFAGNRTIQLTVGSNVAAVNGTNVEMSTKVVIKEGRTYIPAGQLAKILGLKSTWNNETKTATFNN